MNIPLQINVLGGFQALRSGGEAVAFSSRKGQALLAYLAVGWLLLHGLQVWLPVVEFGVAQLLMFWLFVRLKLLRDDQEMRHTVLRRMALLQEYMLPPGFYQLDEHWAQVINFVDQTLNLNRATSPSCIMYSLPSRRILPASLAPCSPLHATKSS